MGEGSKKYSLNREDGKRLAIGAGVALGGAFLTYLTQITTEVDFGQWQPLVVALASIIVNTGRKFLTDYSK